MFGQNRGTAPLISVEQHGEKLHSKYVMQRSAKLTSIFVVQHDARL
jgi:hypothetical protein